MRNRANLILSGLLVLVTSTGAGQTRSAVEPLVEPAWLQGRLGDPSIVVLHIGRTPEDYREGHLPGARLIPGDSLWWSGDPAYEVEFRPAADLGRVLRNAGVGRDSRIVVYGPSPLGAARAWVTLDYLGLGSRSYLLNGGLAAWKEAGGAVETGAPTPLVRGDLALTPGPDIAVTAEWIRDRLDDPDVLLLDARPDDEYTGADGGMGGMARPGHIPGAVQLYWEGLVDSTNKNRFLPLPELARILSSHGARPGKTIVSYCMVGLRASVNYLAMRALGLDVRFYDGSWHDWGTRKDVPVVAGPNPRL